MADELTNLGPVIGLRRVGEKMTQLLKQGKRGISPIYLDEADAPRR
jgi:hypothetical protein